MRWIVPLLLAIAPAQAVSVQAADTNNSDRLSYVFITADGSDMMSGSTDDITRARALQAGHAPLLYIRDHGASYVIRDAAILRRAEEIMRPQRELGRRQGELGNQQGELGHRQAALGEQQAELGHRQAELGRQQARAAEIAQPQFRALVADALQHGLAQRVN